jgi:hypothetical protein
MTRRRLGGLLLALTLCACSRVGFVAPAADLDDGVHIEIDKAFVRGADRVFIDAYVSNNNQTTIRVDKNDWSVKLPTGEMITTRMGASEGDVYVIGPGMGRAVSVDFHKEGYDLRSLTELTLIVGGIQIGESSTPYVVGEVKLTRAPEEPEGK